MGSEALRRVIALTLGALSWAVAAVAIGSATAGDTLTVRAPAGAIAGVERAGVREFMGIPYAKPPTGDLRWQPPRPMARWSGTYKASAFPNACPQDSPNVFAAPSNTEDCLYLNVFAPDGTSVPSRGWPVMVWIHGGGLFSGSSADYEGGELARRGHVVLVTLNYRLGALGFLSHPALNAEGHMAINYGLMDQRLALQWVQTNIESFGGDPGNVTLFGQSGGATAVMALSTARGVKGLFERIIVQSGTRIAPLAFDAALKQGVSFAAAAGCADQSARCLRSLTVEQILAHQHELTRQIATHFPVLDRQLLIHDPVTALRGGEFNAGAVMNGLVADEQAYFLPEPVTGRVLTEQAYAAWAKELGKDKSQWILQQYAVAKYGSPSAAEIAAAQDAKRCIAKNLDDAWAGHGPVFSYEFADRSVPSYYPRVSFRMGAYHTSELQYLFPLFHGARGTAHPLSLEQHRTADLLVRLWSSFAASGQPSDDGRFVWAAANTEHAAVLLIKANAEVSMEPLTRKESHCESWDPINRAP
jgi:para-nitrobenzyl esterase